MISELFLTNSVFLSYFKITINLYLSNGWCSDSWSWNQTAWNINNCQKRNIVKKESIQGQKSLHMQIKSPKAYWLLNIYVCLSPAGLETQDSAGQHISSLQWGTEFKVFQQKRWCYNTKSVWLVQLIHCEKPPIYRFYKKSKLAWLVVYTCGWGSAGPDKSSFVLKISKMRISPVLLKF